MQRFCCRSTITNPLITLPGRSVGRLMVPASECDMGRINPGHRSRGRAWPWVRRRPLSSVTAHFPSQHTWRHTKEGKMWPRLAPLELRSPIFDKVIWDAVCRCDNLASGACVLPVQATQTGRPTVLLLYPWCLSTLLMNGMQILCFCHLSMHGSQCHGD